MNAQKANNTMDKVRQLQRKLYLAAKNSRTRRFHALYDKLWRKDILWKAWFNVKENAGSAGIDGQTIAKIEEIGVETVLNEIAENLKQGKYRPQPVLRVEIPKDNGKKRPLGIPIVKDRIVQAAAKIIIEPIFEADFKECSYGFRPKRNALQALEVIRKACNNKGLWVLDADISGYFDNINHDKLMKLVEMRINDRRMLKLIRQWLKAGIMIGGEFKESELGSPQGGVISPLLANIYLNYLDTIWEKHFSKIGKLVRYADEFVVICKNYKSVQNAFKAVGEIMKRLGLTLSNEKTRIISMWEGKNGFDFLGYHNRMVKCKRLDGREYYQLEQWISAKARKKVRRKVKECLYRNTLTMELEDIIQTLNRKITGWRNYYHRSRWDKLWQLDKYIHTKLVVWYNEKRHRRKRRDFLKLCALFKNMGLKLLSA